MMGVGSVGERWQGFQVEKIKLKLSVLGCYIHRLGYMYYLGLASQEWEILEELWVKI